MSGPIVFVDADTIIAASASVRAFGASYSVLLLGAIGIIECVTSTKAIEEAERNIRLKLPDKLAQFEAIRRLLLIVQDPDEAETTMFVGQAHPKDLSILVAAVQYGCHYLVTFNVKDFHPTASPIVVQRPGEFLEAVRATVGRMVRGTNGAAR